MRKLNKQSTYTPISQSRFIETDNDKYMLSEPVTKNEMYYMMLDLIEEDYLREGQLTSPNSTRKYLQLKLAKYQQEVFCIVFMDNQHQVIAFEELFFGTIDGASVYPREVVKSCLHHNAAAVIFCHNHPSGVSDPSSADINITKRLKDALELVDIRVLDHLIIGASSVVSFAERGLL